MPTRRSVTFGPVTVKRGSKGRGVIPVTTRPDGTEIGIPLTVIAGVPDGPVLCIDGCTHGGEIEGALTLIRVTQEMDPSKLKGILVCVPVLNTPAFNTGRRNNLEQWPPMQDLSEADRNAKGSVTERIADAYYNNVVTKADYVVTIHACGSCDLGYRTESIVVLSDDPETMEMAKGLGPDWNIIRISTSTKEQFEKSKGVAATCIKKGKPYIFMENGGPAGRTPEIIERSISSNVNAIINLMKHLHMMDDEPKYPESWMTTVRDHKVTAGHGGLFRWEPIVGERLKRSDSQKIVKKGAILARIYNLFGEEVESVKSPCDGMIAWLAGNHCAISGNLLTIILELGNEIRPGQ